MRKAADIRLRAERRTGELLKELARVSPKERATAGGNAKAALSRDGTKQEIEPSEYAATLERTWPEQANREPVSGAGERADILPCHLVRR